MAKIWRSVTLVATHTYITHVCIVYVCVCVCVCVVCVYRVCACMRAWVYACIRMCNFYIHKAKIPATPLVIISSTTIGAHVYSSHTGLIKFLTSLVTSVMKSHHMMMM